MASLLFPLFAWWIQVYEYKYMNTAYNFQLKLGEDTSFSLVSNAKLDSSVHLLGSYMKYISWQFLYFSFWMIRYFSFANLG